VLGVVIAPLIEISLRQSLTMSNGQYGIFFQRPISAAFLSGALLLVVIALIPLIRKGIDYGWRKELTRAEKRKKGKKGGATGDVSTEQLQELPQQEQGVPQNPVFSVLHQCCFQCYYPLFDYSHQCSVV
jgi:hypothetical protein